MLSEEEIVVIIKKYVNDQASLVKLAKENHINTELLKDILISKGIHIRNRTESLQKYVKKGVCVICNREFRMREKWNSSTNHHKQTCGNPDCIHTLRSQVQINCWEQNPKRREYMSQLFKECHVDWLSTIH